MYFISNLQRSIQLCLLEVPAIRKLLHSKSIGFRISVKPRGLSPGPVNKKAVKDGNSRWVPHLPHRLGILRLGYYQNASTRRKYIQTYILMCVYMYIIAHTNMAHRYLITPGTIFFTFSSSLRVLSFHNKEY
jgi:hypothetical protein